MTSLRADEQAHELVERARVAECWRTEELRHHRRWCMAATIIAAVLLTVAAVLFEYWMGR